MSPTKLTPEVHAALVESLSNGSYVASACAAAGIHRKTFYEWMREAEKPEASDALRAFAADVHRAVGTSENELVEIIKKASFEDWRAAAFLIERRHPKRWNEKSERKLSGNVGINGEVTPAKARELMSEAFTPTVAPKDSK